LIGGAALLTITTLAAEEAAFRVREASNFYRALSLGIAIALLAASVIVLLYKNSENWWPKKFWTSLAAILAIAAAARLMMGRSALGRGELLWANAVLFRLACYVMPVALACHAHRFRGEWKRVIAGAGSALRDMAATLPSAPVFRAWTRGDWLIAAALGVAAAAGYAAVASNYGSVFTDFLCFVEMAQKMLGRFEISKFTHGYYPFGYSFLLALLHKAGADYIITGKIISAVCGGGIVATAFLLTRQLFAARFAAILAALLCGFNPVAMQWSIEAAADAPLALGLLACTAIVVTTIKSTDRKEIYGGALLGGLTLGITYLVKYSALTLLPGMLFAVLILTKIGLKHRLTSALLILAGFIVTASPQLAASAIANGNPLANRQVNNVLRGLTFDDPVPGAWWPQEESFPEDIGLLQVVMDDPGKFARHWLGNMGSIPGHLQLGSTWLILALAGAAAALAKRSAGAMAIFAMALSYAGAIAMAFCQGRFLILIIALTAVFAAGIPDIVLTGSISKYVKASLLIVIIPLTAQALATIDRGGRLLSNRSGCEAAPLTKALREEGATDLNAQVAALGAIATYFLEDGGVPVWVRNWMIGLPLCLDTEGFVDYLKTWESEFLVVTPSYRNSPDLEGLEMLVSSENWDPFYFSNSGRIIAYRLFPAGRVCE